MASNCDNSSSDEGSIDGKRSGNPPIPTEEERKTERSRQADFIDKIVEHSSTLPPTVNVRPEQHNWASKSVARGTSVAAVIDLATENPNCDNSHNDDGSIKSKPLLPQSASKSVARGTSVSAVVYLTKD
jgi:hypothetical protein